MTNRVVKVVLRGDISDLTGKLKAAQAGIQQTGDRMTGATREATRFRGGLSAVGDTAGKVGLAAAAGLGAIIVATARFDKAMSAVQAATHGSASSMEELRGAALKAGADTAFSASEAANAIEELAKAGVSTKDILGGGLTGSLNLAAAGALGVGEAAEIAATAMTQFQLDGSQVGHVSDLLAAAAGKAQGSVSDMGAALQQSGLVAAQTGLSIEETTGTLAAMAAAGLTGSDAGTALKSALQSLTPTSAAAQQKMQELGISAYDAQGNFSGMASFAGTLEKGLSTLSVEQQNAALKTIFGSDAVRAAAVIFEQGAAGITKWTDKVNDGGYAAETAALRMDNLSGDVEKLKGSLETAFIGAGDGSTGPLRHLVQGATDAADAFGDLPPAAQNVATGMLAITAVTGGAAFFGAQVIGGIASTRASLTALGITAAQTKSALIGIGTAAAAITAAGIAVGKLDSMDDANQTTKELDMTLRGLADGQTVKGLNDLSFGANNLGEALKQAAFNDIHFADAADEIKDIDEALASVDPAMASAAFKTITTEGKKAGLSTKDLAGIFPQYTEAAYEAKKASEALPVRFNEAGAAVDSLGREVEGAKNSVDTFKDSLNALLDPVIGQDAAANAWKDSVASLAEELTKTGGNLDDNTVKGRKNQDSIRGRVQALKDSIQADADAGVGQDKLAGKLQRGRAKIIEAGRAAGFSEREMRKYLKQLNLTPEKLKTVINADTAEAMAKLRAINRFIEGMHGKTVKVKVEGGTPGGLTVGSAGGGAIPRAGGGSVIGPGTGTSDSITAAGPGAAQYLLSNGEHILTASDVKAIGGQERVYAMRAGLHAAQRSYANGGAMGGWTGGGGQSVVSVELKGAKVAPDRNGMLQFVDGRVEVILGARDARTRQQAMGA